MPPTRLPALSAEAFVDDSAPPGTPAAAPRGGPDPRGDAPAPAWRERSRIIVVTIARISSREYIASSSAWRARAARIIASSTRGSAAPRVQRGGVSDEEPVERHRCLASGARRNWPRESATAMDGRRRIVESERRSARLSEPLCCELCLRH